MNAALFLLSKTGNMAQAHKFRKGKSLFATTLTTGIGTGTGDTVTLNSTSGLPTDTEITLTFGRVDSDGTVRASNLVERITGVISGSTLTSYTRGIDGTTEQSHASGTVVEYIWNADDLNDIVDGILVQHSQAGVHTSALVTSLKATGAEVTTGTEDAKIVTPKALKDAGLVLVDEDNMASNSAVKVPTQQSVKAYVDRGLKVITSDTDGATVTFDLSTSNIHTVTLAGNRTLALSNASVGQVFIINLVQDGTGTRTVTWFTTIKWAGGSAPTLTTTINKIDTLGFICTSTDNYSGYVVGQNL